MDQYTFYAFVLLALGLAFMILEVFIPSGGILGLGTFVSLTASVVFAYAAWYQHYPQRFWGFVGILILLIPATLGTTLYLLPHTRLGKNVILEAPDPDDVEPFPQEIARLQRLVGCRGRTLTLLNPGGLVLVNGERHHAFTERLLLEPNTEIEVLAVRGTRLLVGPIASQGNSDVKSSSDQKDHIDFDIPSG